MQEQSSPTVATYRGRVVWFDNKRGFGFLSSFTGGPDVFCHYSGIESEEKFRRLEEGALVEYEIQPGEKGPVAVRVKVVSK